MPLWYKIEKDKLIKINMMSMKLLCLISYKILIEAVISYDTIGITVFLSHYRIIFYIWYPLDNPESLNVCFCLWLLN